MKKMVHSAILLLFFMSLLCIDSQASAQTASEPDHQGTAVSGAVLEVEKEWAFELFGTYIGRAGMVVQDLNGDGIEEMIVGADDASKDGVRNNYWYVLISSGTNQYQQKWVSEKYTSDIIQIAAADVDGDGVSEIFIEFSDATVRVFSGSDFTQKLSFTASFVMQSMLLADVDGNGQSVLVGSDTTHLAAYHPVTGKQLWSSRGYGNYISVGNVDADVTPEIVFSNGYVLNGATRSVEWNFPVSYTEFASVYLGDVNGDGVNEILSLTDWKSLTAFSASSKSLLWTYSVYWEAREIALADVNGDGRAEILYMDLDASYLHCMDGLTASELWKIKPKNNTYISKIAVADLDQDKDLEMLASDSGQGDHLLVIDIATGQVEWESEDLEGPLNAVDVGDVDDDGQAEIVMVSYQSQNFYGSVLKVFDAETHAVEWTYGGKENYIFLLDANSVRIGDVDQDGETEIVVIGGNGSSGKIQIYNGRTHTLERESQVYLDYYIYSMELGDVDGDGEVEIIVGQLSYNAEGAALYLSVIDGASAVVEWQSVGVGKGSFWKSNMINDIHLADVDGDMHVEILVSVKSQAVFIFDGSTHTLDTFLSTQANAIATADPDRDGVSSILVGRTDGSIDTFNGKNYVHMANIPITTGEITCLTTMDVNLDGNVEWILCGSNKLLVYSPEARAILWQNSFLGNYEGFYVGWLNHIPLADIDRDHKLEILVGTDDCLYQFETPWSGYLAGSSMKESPGIGQPGTRLTVTVNLVNLSDMTIGPIQFNQLLSEKISFVPNSLSVPVGVASFTDGRIAWSGNLPERQSTRLVFQVQVNPGVSSLKIVNFSAQISSELENRDLSTQFYLSPQITKVFLPSCNYGNCYDLFDSFNDPLTGWLVGNDTRYKAGYWNGEYQILAKDTRYMYMVKAPTCSKLNYLVETDVRWGGTVGYGYGLIFGLRENFSEYYLLLVDSRDEIYTLYYYDSTGLKQIAQEYLNGLDYDAIDHLSVTRNGSKLFFKIDQFEYKAINDSRISGPTYVGLVIVPFSDLPNADVRFDNFKVIGLPDSTVYYSEKPVINSVTGLSPTADELLVDLPEPLWVNQLVK